MNLRADAPPRTELTVRISPGASSEVEERPRAISSLITELDRFTRFGLEVTLLMNRSTVARVDELMSAIPSLHTLDNPEELKIQSMDAVQGTFDDTLPYGEVRVLWQNPEDAEAPVKVIATWDLSEQAA